MQTNCEMGHSYRWAYLLLLVPIIVIIIVTVYLTMLIAAEYVVSNARMIGV